MEIYQLILNYIIYLCRLNGFGLRYVVNQLILGSTAVYFFKMILTVPGGMVRMKLDLKILCLSFLMTTV